jgi:hypothetical protein
MRGTRLFQNNPLSTLIKMSVLSQLSLKMQFGRMTSNKKLPKAMV